MDLLKEALELYPRLTPEEREIIHAMIKETACNPKPASASPQEAGKNPARTRPDPDR